MAFLKTKDLRILHIRVIFAGTSIRMIQVTDLSLDGISNMRSEWDVVFLITKGGSPTTRFREKHLYPEPKRKAVKPGLSKTVVGPVHIPGRERQERSVAQAKNRCRFFYQPTIRSKEFICLGRAIRSDLTGVRTCRVRHGWSKAGFILQMPGGSVN